jgi:N-acetylglucosamine-6-sulfatase
MFLLNSLRQVIRPSQGRQRTLPGLSHRARLSRPLALEQLESRQLLSSVSQPNFVFILTDDQEAASMQYMPRVQALLGDQGVTFENMFVTTPLCCPSNVSILTGQYAHNTGILHNVPPQGGFQKFVDMRTDGDPTTLGDENTLATWLQDAGYLTGRVGKYLVGYPEDSTYIPPGWDEWHSSYGGFTTYFNYALNENGTVVEYGADDEDYITDVLTQRSVEFVESAAASDQPFFLVVAPTAPHSGTAPNGPPIPAPRHLGMFDGLTAPRTPSFNEADVSDKPPHIRDLPPLTSGQIAAIDKQHQARIESLQAVDEGVERIIEALAERGELENSYIFFTSDNGYHLGQHRQFQGKGEAYEDDIRVPLLVRGPGVRAGATLNHMAVNIDFAPTIVELAGATAGRVMDGRSLAPLVVRDTPPPHNWRKDFLVEIYRNPPMQPGSPGFALRTRHELYVEYADGFRELYNLQSDPYQLDNLYDTADKGHLKQLSQRLAELIVSSGPSDGNAAANAAFFQPAPGSEQVWPSASPAMEARDQARHSLPAALLLNNTTGDRFFTRNEEEDPAALGLGAGALDSNVLDAALTDLFSLHL